MNPLNPRESQRQTTLQRVIRSIIEFETELLDTRHNRECIYLMLLEVFQQRMQARCGVIFADPREKRINEFFQAQVQRPLADFTGSDVVEFRALEAKVLKHFADVIDHIRDTELLREDLKRQELTAAQN